MSSSENSLLSSVAFSLPAFVVCGVFAIILATAASAQTTTYTYTGKAFQSSLSEFISPTVCPISGSFTVPNPIPPNGDVTIFPTSYSFTDCATTITNENSRNDGLEVGTDANGNINAWNLQWNLAVDVLVTCPALCPSYDLDSFTATNFELGTIVDPVAKVAADYVYYSNPQVGASDGNLNDPGTWICSPNCLGTTVAVTVASVDLVKNILGVTLSDPGNSFSGALDLIASGESNGNQTISVDNGAPLKAGTYQVPFDRVSLTPDVFGKVIAQWNVNGGINSSPFDLSPEWNILGLIRNSQYNTVYEEACPTKTAPKWMYNRSCNFTQINLSAKFAFQTQVNGTGVSKDYGILKAGVATAPSLCKGQFPKGADRANSFLTVSDITGSCNKVLNGGVEVAVYPNPAYLKKGPPPYLCKDGFLLVDPHTKKNFPDSKTVLDYCPACSAGFNGTDGHVDNYTSTQACSAHNVGDLGNYWEADTGVSSGTAETTAYVQVTAKTSLFNPNHQKEISTQDKDFTLSSTRSEAGLAVSIDGNHLQSVVPLPEEMEQVNEILRYNNRAVVIGMVNGSVSEMVVLDLDHRSVIDEFLGFNPVVSPDGRFVAFIKFYPPHFVDGPDDHYMLYDVSKGPSENRPYGTYSSDEMNVGLTMYPAGLGNSDGDNVGVPQTRAHHIAGEFFWSPDSQQLVFADQTTSVRLLMVRFSSIYAPLSAGVFQLQGTNVCTAPLLLDDHCEAYLRRIEFQSSALKASFSGRGTKASVHRDLVVSDSEFLTSAH
jgi:hypothetical protein